MTATTGPRFSKGHGTGNDFVIISNLDGELSIDANQVARICDRRTGLGGDGVLIVTPSELIDSASSAQWFMDYRNADGSIAQMCGNGVRVFARYLREFELETSDSFLVGTRGGDRQVAIEADGNIRVGMGKPTTLDAAVSVEIDDQWVAADAWWIPNPHAVVFVDDLDAFSRPLPAPQIQADVFPEGQNVEYVRDLSSQSQLHAEMRVHERGVGETQSCGTGVCAAALSVRRRHGVQSESTTTIDVPGGRLWVNHRGDGQLELIGPAVLTAHGEFDAHWWEGEQ